MARNLQETLAVTETLLHLRSTPDREGLSSFTLWWRTDYIPGRAYRADFTHLRAHHCHGNVAQCVARLEAAGRTVTLEDHIGKES